MIVHSQQQALRVAVGMEKRAIYLYERALLFIEEDEMIEAVESILTQEREHLCRFSSMAGELNVYAEDKILEEALAAGTLFPGGVMAMLRGDAFSTPEMLFEYAAREERTAVESYRHYAELSEDPEVKEAFLAIAEEEALHLAALESVQ